MVPSIKIPRGTWSTEAFKGVKQGGDFSVEPVCYGLIFLLKNKYKRISPGSSLRPYQSPRKS